MAQIEYYWPNGTALRDSDQVPDWAVESYPAPEGWVVYAVATFHGRPKILYGYGGKWHDQPPPKVQELEIKLERERGIARLRSRDAAVAALEKLPSATVIAADSDSVTVVLDGDEPAVISRHDLEQATDHENPAIATLYRGIRTAAARLLDRSSRGQPRRVTLEVDTYLSLSQTQSPRR